MAKMRMLFSDDDLDVDEGILQTARHKLCHAFVLHSGSNSVYQQSTGHPW